MRETKKKHEIISGVYSITNLVNGKVYYGRSEDIYRRWNSHKNHLIKGEHVNKELQWDWDKYGSNNFIFEIVEESDLSTYKYRELWYIFNYKNLVDLYNVISPKDEIIYNLCNYLLSVGVVDFEIDYINAECIGRSKPLNWNLHLSFRGKDVYVNLYNQELYEKAGRIEDLHEANLKRQQFVDNHDNFEMINLPYGEGRSIEVVEKEIIDRLILLLKDL